MNVPRLVIAGTHSGVGKTTVTMAILAALKRRGHRVQAFKVGPDFIDPGHHTALTGRVSRNVDGWMLGPERSREVLRRSGGDADVCIIEGMMGLFDGSSAIDEKGSTAEMAKVLRAPVLLVLDGSSLARSAAAMADGYARFDQDVNVAGIVLNRIGGEGHYRLLKEAIEATTSLRVVGYLGEDPALSVPDRHLGLVTALEHGGSDWAARLAEAAQTVDLDAIVALAHAAEPLPSATGESVASAPSSDARAPIHIGVAYDQAFCFYYAENLELLEAEGGTLIRFSPLRDTGLPDVDLLYIGGGYPELHGAALAGNTSMRRAIYEFGTAGGTIYAECGGLMYLANAIRDFEGQRHAMVGLLDAEAVMPGSPLTIGYREFQLSSPCLLGEPSTTIRGHEFHRFSLVSTRPLQYTASIFDAQGRHRGQDGVVTGNVLACAAHLHFASRPTVAKALVETARRTSSMAVRRRTAG